MGQKTPLMLEQHIHGAFGIDFNKVTNPKEIVLLAEKLLQHGIGGFFPTLVTDTVENIKKQISVVKAAAKYCPQILGIHLEGIFINPLKKGIHNSEWLLPLTIENYKLIEDDFIKIITLAPELDEGLIGYLRDKDIKIQAGHCMGDKTQNTTAMIDGFTHTFNAMSGITHRDKSITLSALTEDSKYAEIITDGLHVSDEALKMFFRTKPVDKVILVSDALPITESSVKECEFAGSKIYYNGFKATSADGTLAGSTTLLDKLVKRLAEKGLFNSKFIENPYNYHNIKPIGEILWNDDWSISKVIYKGNDIL